MTIEEYNCWKENNPQEFEQISKECLESWIKEDIKNKLDNITFESPTTDKNLQVVTYRKILEALTRKDDFCSGLCDEFIKIYKQYLDYKKNHN